VSTQSTSELIDSIAIELNEDAKRIRVQNPIWARYAQQGVTVSLHIEREHFRTSLSFGELGIDSENEAERKSLRKIVEDPVRYLIPKDWAKKGGSIADEARACLKRHAYDTHWGFWIHTNNYDTWRTEHNEIEQKFLAFAQELVDRYDELVQEARVSYLGLCQQTYDRLSRTLAARDGRIPGFQDREQWVLDSVQRMVSVTPSRERILSKFRMYYDVRVLPLQENIAEDERRANQIRLDAVTATMVEDLRRTEARRAAGGMQQFVEELQAEIRAQVYDATVSSLEVLETNDGRLSRNASATLKRLVEKCSQMVFWEEPDLERRVAEMSRILDVPSNKRSPSELRGVLQELGAEARLVLMGLNREPERSGNGVGIPDDVPALEVIARRGAESAAEMFDAVDFDMTRVAQRGEANIALF
jgi:hypothetical protein